MGVYHMGLRLLRVNAAVWWCSVWMLLCVIVACECCSVLLLRVNAALCQLLLRAS